MDSVTPLLTFIISAKFICAHSLRQQTVNRVTANYKRLAVTKASTSSCVPIS